MGIFAAVAAETLIERAFSDEATPTERADAQRLVADLLGSCPETIDRMKPRSLGPFLFEPVTDPAVAADVVRALSRSSEMAKRRFLPSYLARPDLALSDIEPHISPLTAPVLASESDRPDVLELVFADPEARSTDTVLKALANNEATPAGLRVQAVARLLSSIGSDTDTPNVDEALRALRERPEICRPAFDELDLPAETLLNIFTAFNKVVWVGLGVQQLDRLVDAFEQVVPNSENPLAWHDCSWRLLLHPGMSADSSQRLVAAVPAECETSTGMSTGHWFRELSEAVEVLSAPNRVAGLLGLPSPPDDDRYNKLWTFVLSSASSADIVEVLTTPDTHPYSRSLLIRRIVKFAPFEVCTSELLAVLPPDAFRAWRERLRNTEDVDAVFAELLVSRLGTDPAVWRTFTDLAEVAADDVTVGEVVDLAASLSAASDERRRPAGT